MVTGQACKDYRFKHFESAVNNYVEQGFSAPNVFQPLLRSLSRKVAPEILLQGHQIQGVMLQGISGTHSFELLLFR